MSEVPEELVEKEVHGWQDYSSGLSLFVISFCVLISADYYGFKVGEPTLLPHQHLP